MFWSVLICCVYQLHYSYKWLQSISYALTAGWFARESNFWDLPGSMPRVLIILGSQFREQPHDFLVYFLVLFIFLW